MPWVPRDLYDCLLTALRTTQAGPIVSAPVLGPAASPPALSAMPDDSTALPEPVVAACIHYAFGDLEEQAENFRRALSLQVAGRTPSEIVGIIRDGAKVDGWFV